MTALSASAPAVRRRPVPWTRLAWVTWRQHRLALAGAAALLGALSLYLLIYGLKINHAYAPVAACHPAGSSACRPLADTFNQEYFGGSASALQSGGVQTISSLLLIVPVLIGVFCGAPLLARELETGTFRFAWTQGCGRLRWAVTKLVLLAAVLTGAAAAFTVLFSWYVHPFIADGKLSALLPLAFGLRGVAFAAWTLAAFAIAAFAGAAIRRTVPAMAASLAAWTVLDLAAVIFLRQHYEAPLSLQGGAPFMPPPGLGRSWVVGSWTTGPGGKLVSQLTVNQMIPAGVQNSPHPNALQAWMSQHHYVQWWAYQPQSRFWPFQLIEGGWLLALSLVLIAATVWLVRRRAA